MLWDVTIFAMTVIGIRRNHLPTKSQLWRALLKQGTGYILATVLTTIPMTASVASLLDVEH
jgi:hypothetical protein